MPPISSADGISKYFVVLNSLSTSFSDARCLHFVIKSASVYFCPGDKFPIEIGKSLRMFNVKKAFLYLLILGAVISGALWSHSRFEWHPPVVSIKLDNGYIGTKPFDIEIKDRGRGLKMVSVVLRTAGKDYTIATEEYDSLILSKKLTVSLSLEELQLKDGPGVLRVSARDRSYWGFFRGNETTQELYVVIDLTPPSLHLVSGDRYINYGGTGLIFYQSSPDTVRSGVKIGSYFFPGYRGKLKAPDTYLAFFAHPHDVTDQKAVIIAEDAAGNVTQRKLAYTLRNIRNRKKNVQISDRLIQRKVMPLLERRGTRPESLKDAFIAVNHDLRRQNEATIREACRQSVNEMMWELPFHQLSNSKVEANFGVERTYYYKGEVIDRAFHLGYDLAVTRKYPIEAANSGVVVFGEDLGIYGRTVIIDHGLGLFTLYSHMSSINVKKGDRVERKQIIGKTGETGLTTGDHLHYGTLIHGIPVLPLEWWDSRWVEENILSRVEAGISGQL